MNISPYNRKDVTDVQIQLDFTDETVFLSNPKNKESMVFFERLGF